MKDSVLLSIYQEFAEDSRYLIERVEETLVFWVRNTKRSYTLTRLREAVIVKAYAGEFGPKGNAQFGLGDPDLMIELREFMT